MPAPRIIAAIRGAVSRDTYKYSAIPEPEAEVPRRQSLSRRASVYESSSQGQTRLIKMSLGGMALFAILLTMVSLGYEKQKP